jgi:hypothetical protein
MNSQAGRRNSIERAFDVIVVGWRRGAYRRDRGARGGRERAASREERKTGRIDRLVGPRAARRIRRAPASATAARSTGATWRLLTATSITATTPPCDASSPRPCRTRSAGFFPTASGSTDPCRSRRTQSRACTTCCRTRAPSLRGSSARPAAPAWRSGHQRALLPSSPRRGVSWASRASAPQGRIARAQPYLPRAISPAIPNSRVATWGRARRRSTG